MRQGDCPVRTGKKSVPTCGYANEPDISFCIIDGVPLVTPVDSNMQYMAFIKEFLEIMSNDDNSKAKTSRKNASFQIAFTDTKESFYIFFDKGMIDAGLGAYPSGADFIWSLPTNVFDGIMTGKATAAKAIQDGTMTFVGNLRKALIPLFKLMMDSYRKAITKVGKVNLT